MEIPNDYTQKFTTASDIKSKRDEQIRRFLDHGIKLRKRKTLENATERDLALILRAIPTDRLHDLYRECERARSFGRFFWWRLRQEGVLHAVPQGVAEQVGDGGDMSGMRDGDHARAETLGWELGCPP